MRYVTLLLCLFLGMASFAQDSNKIIVKSNYWIGNKIFKDGQQLSKEKFLATLSGHDRAFQLAEKGFGQQSTSQVFAFIGGFMIGWPIGSALGGADKPGWGLVPAGAGVILIGWPIYNGGSKKIKEAASIYNSNEGLTHFNRAPSFQLSFMTRGNEIGFRLQF